MFFFEESWEKERDGNQKATHFERKFSATADYDSSSQLAAVQEELVTQMIKDITEQIFNATVANW